MSNWLQKAGAVDTQRFQDNFDSRAEEGAHAGGMSYMKFSGKRGTISIGKEDREPDDGELYLVNVLGFQIGYVSWKGGKPVGKKFALAQNDPVPEPDPVEGGPYNRAKNEGWSPARSLAMVSLDHEQQIVFETNSKTGVSGIADLHMSVSERMQEGSDCWPVVVMSSEPFEAQGFKNFRPVFEVVAWLSSAEVAEISEGTTTLAELAGVVRGEPAKVKKKSADKRLPKKRAPKDVEEPQEEDETYEEDDYEAERDIEDAELVDDSESDDSTTEPEDEDEEDEQEPTPPKKSSQTRGRRRTRRSL